MVLDRESEEEIIKKFQLHERDTGSADVQIALWTEEISKLKEHLDKYSKDHSARLSLLKTVAKRRKMLNYLKTTDVDRYSSLVEELGIRK